MRETTHALHRLLLVELLAFGGACFLPHYQAEPTYDRRSDSAPRFGSPLSPRTETTKTHVASLTSRTFKVTELDILE